MRHRILAAALLTICNVAPVLAEDSFIQPQNMPAGADALAKAPPDGPTYDECFQLGWVRGVHVERGEWQDFYNQCLRGEVPFESGMGVDSVKLDHHAHAPHS
jgi:hypothetical protein